MGDEERAKGVGAQVECEGKEDGEGRDLSHRLQAVHSTTTTTALAS